MVDLLEVFRLPREKLRMLNYVKYIQATTYGWCSMVVYQLFNGSNEYMFGKVSWWETTRLRHLFVNLCKYSQQPNCFEKETNRITRVFKERRFHFSIVIISEIAFT